jgi:hypothetical protein
MLQFADFSISNYYTEEAIFIEDLTISRFNSKRGLTVDSLSVDIHREVLDHIAESFSYICYRTKVKVIVDDLEVLDGYIDKIAISTTGNVSWSIVSIVTWFQELSLAPKLSFRCQNQIYSQTCGLNPMKHSIEFRNVNIDLFTGNVPLAIDVPNKAISLGGGPPINLTLEYFDGNVSTYDGNSQILIPSERVPPHSFLELKSWWNAYVIINDKYRSEVTFVGDNYISLAISHTVGIAVADKLEVYLSCDKTYGICYNKFDNLNNFWGFANLGQTISTIDIFTASNLEYCGADYADTSFEYCASDFSLFGVNLNE